jgi:hypothetical protein
VLKVFLIVNLPVYLDRPDPCILKFELLCDGSRVCDNAWHWEGGRCGLVVETHLVDWYDNRTSRDANADGELKVTETLNVRDDLIVEFSAYIVVNCDSDWYLRMRWQLSQVRVEDYGYSLVI